MSIIKKYFFLKLLTVCVFSTGFGQNLTGTWKGVCGGSYWEIGIVQIGDSCYGYSFDAGPGYCKVNFQAVYDSSKNKFKGWGVNFIEKTFGHTLMICNLKYSRQRGEEYLLGTLTPKAAAIKILSFGLPVRGELKKVADTVESTNFIMASIQRRADNLMIEQTDSSLSKNDSMALKNENASIALKKILDDSVVIAQKNSRADTVIREILVNSDTVKITLYDDGVVDGDIVTLFDNGNIIVNKLSLTAKPYEITLIFPKLYSTHTIEIMADNEGSIPPNTAYMLVQADSERIELKASSDKLTNAAIVIQRAPK